MLAVLLSRTGRRRLERCREASFGLEALCVQDLQLSDEIDNCAPERLLAPLAPAERSVSAG
jgi:hypothetical protein